MTATMDRDDLAGDPGTSVDPTKRVDRESALTSDRADQALSAPILRRQLCLCCLLILAACGISGALAPSRAAAISSEEELARFGSEGSAAGQLNFPYGVATDPTTGHVYTVALGGAGNSRIDEFTPWGSFVKAFGWDVAPGPVNEQQEVRVRAAGGQFRLSFGGSTTPDLAFDAPGPEVDGAGSVEAALNALPSIGGAAGNVEVTSTAGTVDGQTPYIYIVTFKGSLAGSDVPEMTASDGTDPLGGGSPSTSVEVRTRANGSAAGAGLESCTSESGCQAGLTGSGAGEMDAPIALAVDAAGDIYIREIGTDERVQKFAPDGRFLLMFGGEVDQTTGANVCTASSGDLCGAGVSGVLDGQFSGGTGVTIGPTGAVFVADTHRIQRFSPQGVYEASLPVPGKTVSALAADPRTGDLYATLEPDGSFSVEPDVAKLDPATGNVLNELPVEAPAAVATDRAGNVYVIDKAFTENGGEEHPESVLQFNGAGQALTPSSCCSSPDGGLQLRGLGLNTSGTLYIAEFSNEGGAEALISAFGPGPTALEAPPKVSPSITAQFAVSVQPDAARISGLINPHFWTDTRYYVEYGTGECSAGACGQNKPVPPGALLSAKTSGSPVKATAVTLEGLQPDTVYHYRLVAQSGGGGPVTGIGGTPGAPGTESTFETPPTARAPKADCPNAAFRVGFSAPLPDCRAYEMVSPVDKEGGNVKTLLSFFSYSNALDQSALDGNSFTFSSYRAFGEPQGAPMTNQYLATRHEGTGWEAPSITPRQSVENTNVGFPFVNWDNDYRAFSPNLCQSWLFVNAAPPLAPVESPDFAALYSRRNCPSAAGFETLAQAEDRATPEVELQGVTANGSASVVNAVTKLSPTEEEPAAAEGKLRAYYLTRGEAHLICILPDGTRFIGRCAAGTTPVHTGIAAEGENNRFGTLTHALSEDGSKVYWTATSTFGESGSAVAAGTGAIYLRLNPGAEEECGDTEKACTVKVSGATSASSARFLAASADGSRALFEFVEGTLAGNLYEFDSESASSRLIAKKSLGYVGGADDLSYVYFVSEEKLPGTAGATIGAPNLYVQEDGSTRKFIATLSRVDAPTKDVFGLSDVSPTPVVHIARATPDGKTLAFLSTNPLTGYDNTDAASPVPCGTKAGGIEGVCDSEVFLYRAENEALVCISCDPSGAQPEGRHGLKIGETNIPFTVSGNLTAPTTQLYTPRNLTDDGNRVFFDSYGSLVPRDTNGKEDVYEWEAATGPAECEEAGAESYVRASDGCLSLISSGESPADTEFLDSDEDGMNVFIDTEASLLPQDPGLYDVYDVRVGGGFATATPSPGCEGEACQGPASPPDDPTPASSTYNGPGNVKPASKPKSKETKKKKHKKKKHKKKKHKKVSDKAGADHNGRVGR